MDDHCPVTLLDHVGQYGKCRGQAGVSFGEDIDIRTFTPRHIDGCVDGLFDIFTIEIEGKSLGLEGRAAVRVSGKSHQ